MGFYAKHILPRALDFACSMKPVLEQREKVVPLAEGQVLEVGIGTGLNLPYYDATKVERVIGLDPAEEMLVRARKRAAGMPFAVEHLALEGERIPLEAGSIDTVLVTYTLCTIPDVLTALDGMRRVLKPTGRLIFCEHGMAPDARVLRWQKRINPLWSKLLGGCTLDRDVPSLLKQSGFAFDTIESAYLDGGPAIASFNYWGTARPT